MYCQKCRTPLRADSTLDDLNPAAFDLLVGSAGKNAKQTPSPETHGVSYPEERRQRYEQSIKQTQNPLYKRTIPPAKDANPGMSFIEITQSEIVPSATPHRQSDHQKTTSNVDTASDKSAPLASTLLRQERLFSILSAHSDVDHPICSECSSLLLTGLNTRLANATRERDAYASFLKQMQQASLKHKDDEATVKKELAALQKEEEDAMTELAQLEEQKKLLESELADLEDQEKVLEKEEQTFWLSRNLYNEHEHALKVELASLHQKHAHDQKQYDKLQRTNVYNDTFFISHDGNFGTINGLRLGRLPTITVEWAEINAAWGQTLLLLQTLAERLSFSFQGYRLRPLGSTSRIEKLDYGQQPPDAAHQPATRSTNPSAPARVTPLELYSSGAALNRVFQSRKFDQAMVAFLDCLAQLGKHVERSSTSVREGSRPSLSRTPSAPTNPTVATPMRLPYIIEGDRIWSRDRPDEAFSIKLGVGFAPDESFTKACKYVLTCCKYLLAHVSNLDNSRPTQQ